MELQKNFMEEFKNKKGSFMGVSWLKYEDEYRINVYDDELPNSNHKILTIQTQDFEKSNKIAFNFTYEYINKEKVIYPMIRDTLSLLNLKPSEIIKTVINDNGIYTLYIPNEKYTAKIEYEVFNNLYDRYDRSPQVFVRAIRQFEFDHEDDKPESYTIVNLEDFKLYK